MFSSDELSALELIDSDMPKEKILYWPYIPFGNWARLYYKPHITEHSGFIAYLIELSAATDEEDWSYDNLDNLYHPLLKVTALFDGIRHWEFNPIEEAEGYLHYTKPEVLGQVMSELAGLVQEYCMEEAL